MIAPMNLQPMCDHNNLSGPLCHALKTKTGNRQDWRDYNLKKWAELFQSEIEAWLPPRITPWRPYDPELTEAIKRAVGIHK